MKFLNADSLRLGWKRGNMLDNFGEACDYTSSTFPDTALAALNPTFSLTNDASGLLTI